VGTAVCGRRSSRVGYVSESFVAFANRGLVPFHERSLPCRYNIYTNERAQNRESFIAVSIDERTNERTNEATSSRATTTTIPAWIRTVIAMLPPR